MAVYNPEGLHKEFQNSFNAGNLDAIMDLYEADATLSPFHFPSSSPKDPERSELTGGIILSIVGVADLTGGVILLRAAKHRSDLANPTA